MVVIKRMACVLAAVSLLLCGTYAQEPEPKPEEDFEGYIVKVNTNFYAAPAANEISELTPVEFSEDLYVAGTLEEVEALSAAGLVEAFEPNYLMELFDCPNDDYYVNKNSTLYQWGLDALALDYSWNKNLFGEGVTIGIIDSGVDSNHEDFAGVDLTRGYNFCDEANSADFSDELGHGTAVTGIIAAATNNGVGIAGIAPRAKIVTLKCFSKKEADYATVISAIYKAIAPEDEGGFDCNIINMSFGGPSSELLGQAISAAVSKDVILVASAGNNYDTTVCYPSAYDGVISVGSITAGRTRSAFSNYNSSLDVAAPGSTITSMVAGTNGYAQKNGTSFAAPYVSAVAALAKSIDESMTSDEFKSLIQETSTDLGVYGWDEEYGYGLINAELIIRCLKNDDGIFVVRTDDLFDIYGIISAEPDIGTCSVIASSYDINGRMRSADVFQCKTNIKGQLILPVQNMSLLASANSVSIYVLSSSNVPISEKKTYITSELS